jgi:hypothetical protein
MENQMNSKNALFLSASLTAFILAVLFAVVTKVTNTPIEASAASVAEIATATDVPTDVPTAQVLPSATLPGPLGPEEAANLAAKAINRQDVYSVESFDCNGVACYKVVFVAGDIVYIGLDRALITMAEITPVPTPVVAYAAPVPTTPAKHKSGNNNNNNNNNNQQPPKPTHGEHEGDD